ncbi:MAG: C2H2-type zinc finger protein [Clostridia bacterium]|nr:C2H2-type zinc finger protein [Clostridia bacterium]
MKKIVSIFLAVIIAFSAVIMAAATDYTCKVCGKIYTDVNEYNEHIESHPAESETKEFTCPTCKKVFYDSREYNNHLDTHAAAEETTEESKAE